MTRRFASAFYHGLAGRTCAALQCAYNTSEGWLESSCGERVWRGTYFSGIHGLLACAVGVQQHRVCVSSRKRCLV